MFGAPVRRTSPPGGIALDMLCGGEQFGFELGQRLVGVERGIPRASARAPACLRGARAARPRRPRRSGPGRGGSNGRVSSSSDWASSSDSRVAGSTGLPAPSVRSKEEHLSVGRIHDRPGPSPVFHMTAAEKGERLDRMLAQHRGPFALAPENPDPGRRGRRSVEHDPRSRPSRQCRRQDPRRDPAGRAGGAAPRGYPAQHRLRGRRADRDRQAEGAGGASGGRKPHRHAGQRADRALRRKPFGHRRGQAARHRAPARQGYDRRDGGGEDRPRAPRAVGPIRRPWPHRPAGTGVSRLRLGRAGPPEEARSTPRSTATPRRATSRPCAAGGREAITHWELLERYAGIDGKPVASLLSCRLETGRTHQIRVHLAHIGHPLLGDDTYGPGFKTKAALLRAGSPPSPRGPWQTGPACPYLGLPTPRNRRASLVSKAACRTI